MDLIMLILYQLKTISVSIVSSEKDVKMTLNPKAILHCHYFMT